MSVVRRMYTPNLGVYLFLSITSVSKPCSTSMHRSFHELEFYRIISRLSPISYTRRHIGEDCSRLSVECTLPTLVSICSSTSPLSAKPWSMSVHRSVQKYCTISRLDSKSCTRGVLGRTVVDCRIDTPNFDVYHLPSITSVC